MSLYMIFTTILSFENKNWKIEVWPTCIVQFEINFSLEIFRIVLSYRKLQYKGYQLSHYGVKDHS